MKKANIRFDRYIELVENGHIKAGFIITDKKGQKHYETDWLQDGLLR